MSSQLFWAVAGLSAGTHTYMYVWSKLLLSQDSIKCSGIENEDSALSLEMRPEGSADELI